MTATGDTNRRASAAVPLEGETIVYFGPEPWHGMWRNRHQLMSRLARHNKVVYVEPAAMIRATLRRLFDRRHASRRTRRRQVTIDASGVIIYHSPWWTPLTGRRPFRGPSLRCYLAVLRRICSIEAACKPIVWLSRPQMSEYIGKLQEKLCIYHVVDEYTAYTGVDPDTREWLVEHEKAAARRADAVIVVTPALLASKSAYNPNSYLVPNAVDYAAYADADMTRPHDLAGIRPPVIGFTGLVSARLDFAMLLGAARARPGWSFVFVGSIDDSGCKDELRQMAELDNVHLLGVRPVRHMPAYLHCFDVCTVPYADDESARNASPLKLYEYAAVGKPIVTTDFAAAREFPGHLWRVNGVDDFLQACELALRMSSDAPELVANREFAAGNTWDDRVDQITEIMRAHCRE